MTNSCMVLGVGSPHGDDRIGWQIIDRLHRHQPRLAAAHLQVPVELCEQLYASDRLLIVDAASLGNPPGTITVWHWPQLPPLAASRGGTHGLDLFTALQLAEGLGRLPPEVTLMLVETAEVAPLGEAVVASEQVLAELERQVVDWCAVFSIREDSVGAPWHGAHAMSDRAVPSAGVQKSSGPRPSRSRSRSELP